jgi:hypothetical protein
MDARNTPILMQLCLLLFLRKKTIKKWKFWFGSIFFADLKDLF